MNKFIILVAVMVMGSHGAPINSDSTTQNMNTNSYSTTDITGLLTTIFKLVTLGRVVICVSD